MKKNISLALTLVILTACHKEAPIPSLEERYEKYFPIGAAVGQKQLQGLDSALLTHHFSSLTAENDMKVSRTIKSMQEFSFTAGEHLVDFAERHGMQMRGHTLVWYHQTPGWFYRDSLGHYLSKEQLLQRMRWYIHQVLDHYRGRVYAWDVVNEAIADGSAMFYRQNIDWYRVCGPEYIKKAFVYAHEADPTIKLFYNDYDLINPVKRDKVYKMVKKMIDEGIPIHGIGMQGHWTLEDVNEQNLSAAIDLFASLGVEVQITELDISVYPYYHNMDRSTLPKEVKPYTPELAKQLADKYEEVFKVLRKKSEKITGVTFWGVTDKKTWLSNYVVKGRTDYPLLFDSLYQPKEAFWKVVEFVE